MHLRGNRLACVAMALSWFVGMASAQEPAQNTDSPASIAERSVWVVAPIFHRLVAFHAPGSLSKTEEHTTAKFYIREAVAPSETLEQWTQMITVTGASGLAATAGLTPLRMSETMAAGYKKACPDSYAAKGIGTATVAGRPAYLALVGCGDAVDDHGMPGARHSETALILVIAGEEDYYTIQWAERAPATKTLTFDEAVWRERYKALTPIRICPIVSGEKAPYVNCVGI